jgi:hypothetical protein
MASTRAMLERRRSSRVPIRIPVTVYCSKTDGDALDAPGEVVCVSRYGALVRTPFLPPLGSQIEILHGVSLELRAFRVISVRDPREKGLFELGVEMFYPSHNFWGIQFPDEHHPA